MTTVPPKINHLTKHLNEKFGLRDSRQIHQKVKQILPENAKNQFQIIQRADHITLIIHPAWLTWARLSKEQIKRCLPKETPFSIQPLIEYTALEREPPPATKPTINQNARECLSHAAKQCKHAKLKSILERLSKY